MDPVKCPIFSCLDLSGRSRSSSVSEEEWWRTELLSCFTNKVVCLFVAFCPGGLCFIQARSTEKASGFKSGVAFCIACWLGCFGTGYNRSTIRRAFEIPGSWLKDCLLHCFCSPCAVCQEHEEVELRILSKRNVSSRPPTYIPPTINEVSTRLAHI